MSARPGRITAAIDVDLPTRDDAARQSGTYFARVTEVRRALRGGESPTPQTAKAEAR
jgi:NitT/TauT family transport system ATP-binding protein